MQKPIKFFPKIERPREKLIKYGVQKLTNEELLAIILRSGRRGKNVLEIAKLILKKFDGNFVNISIGELIKVDGIGPVKACEILASIEFGKRQLITPDEKLIVSPEVVWKELIEIKNSKKEHFIVFYLNSQNVEINREVVSIGTLNESIVHPREVFENAIKYSSANIIVCHNHPSGELIPSSEDKEITTRLSACGEILGINVLDHVIISKNGWFSMAENGYMISE